MTPSNTRFLGSTASRLVKHFSHSSPACRTHTHTKIITTLRATFVVIGGIYAEYSIYGLIIIINIVISILIKKMSKCSITN